MAECNLASPHTQVDFRSETVESVKLPPRSPNLNAYAERFVRSIKESCLNRMIFFGEESLRKAIQNFVAHYHRERNHQGLKNQLISPEAGHLGSAGEIPYGPKTRSV